MKKTLLFVFKLAVLIAIYGYLYTKFDLSTLFRHFVEVDWVWFLFALSATLLMYGLAALRWQKVIRAMGSELSNSSTLKIFWIGAFFSQFLFSSIGGDAIRIWLAKRKLLGLRSAIHSIFFDRLSGLMAIVLLMLGNYSVYRNLIERQALTSLVLFLVLILAGIFIFFYIDRVPFLNRIPLFQASLGKMAPDARKVFLSGKMGVVVVAYSLVVLSLTCLIVFAIGRALGQTLSLDAYFLMVPPVILFTILPISIAGWGVREGAMVVAFGFMGMQGEAAIAMSIWFGILLLLSALPGGFLWLFSKERKADVDEVYSASY